MGLIILASTFMGENIQAGRLCMGKELKERDLTCGKKTSNMIDAG